MSKELVLEMLLQSEQRYLSGEIISKKMGVTRAAIWKYIVALREQGYDINSVRNRGYLLVSSPDRLEHFSLCKGFEEAHIGREIVCLPTIDSTNLEVKRRAMMGAESGLVVTSEEQTSGKGRRGRSFHSPEGSGLYFSVLLRPDFSPEELSKLTPWVAVAVCQGIHDTCGISPSIKWTNDLIFGDKKVSGILTELSLESDSGFVEYVVLGIGINVNQQKEDFPSSLADTCSSLAMEKGENICRNLLCQNILHALNGMMEGFPHEKKHYLQEYRERCCTVGREINVLRGEDKRPAKALEIDDEFRLVVEYQDGSTEALASGEVSVRGIHGYI